MLDSILLFSCPHSILCKIRKIPFSIVRYKDEITNQQRFLNTLNYIIVIYNYLPPYRGESYAGIYVPTLVDTIRIMNQNTSDRMNLKGFMVSHHHLYIVASITY